MKRPNIKPRGKWIYVQQDAEPSRETDSGLYTPDTVEQEKKAFGLVLAVGSEIKDIQIGNRVVFGLFAGETLEFKDIDEKVEYKLLHDDDVIAFIEDADEK